MFARLGLYGLVGGISAGLHALLLVFLPKIGIPLPTANLTGFLVASIWSYLAHAKVSFRNQTQGNSFPRRWLLLQLGLNVVLSLLLPTAFSSWARTPWATLVLVFTPTAVNYMVWSLAARHVAWLQARAPGRRPNCHADDLGLDESINDAIFDLADAGQLQGASLMVAGPAVAHALAGLRKRPQLNVCLHLVLSEGPPISPPEMIRLLVDADGLMNLGFGQLLVASIWPQKHSQEFVSQLANEIRAQISTFQSLTGERAIRLDGHQHIHLTPLVWQELLKLEPPLRPIWIRTIREPWPPGLPISPWVQSIVSAGLLKWLVLSLLSSALRRSLKKQEIATNSSFAGVLFTGRMAGSTLKAAFRTLSHWPDSQANQGSNDDNNDGSNDGSNVDSNEGCSAPLVLIHPAKSAGSKTFLQIDSRYRLSTRFYASPWRHMEYQSMAQLAE